MNTKKIYYYSSDNNTHIQTHPNGLELREKAQAHFVTFLNPSLYEPALTEKAQAHFLTFLKPSLYHLLLTPPLMAAPPLHLPIQKPSSLQDLTQSNRLSSQFDRLRS